ncbi:helix-turn-helix transcriptional regulator [Marinomonas sp. S3726]|uniref:helix-turn-helix domain-containing protein n=1 Tax=Marinomonas sp. S3726 TaxID=579484 RepID=UPI0006991E74|nr:helix-turn-helix transcriptional regulator [Marinomonas sp. S3726]
MSKEIGDRVKKVRGDLNQREFAQRLTVSNGSVSQIEQGKAIPSGDFLLKLNKEFEVDITWVLTGLGLSPELRHNLELMTKVTAEVDPDGNGSLTNKMVEAHENVAKSIRQPTEPELKLSSNERSFWDMYKELSEKDQREIYQDIKAKKRLAELEKYFRENEEKKNA